MLIVSIKYVDVPVLHADVYETVIVLLIALFVRQKGRRVEAANFACVRIWLGHLKLDLAIVKILHFPQLEHVGDVDGDEQAAIGHES